jgi:hypothetical protein
MIFGRRVTKEYKASCSPRSRTGLGQSGDRNHYGNGSGKQYVRDERLLRTEPATNNVRDYRRQ